MPHVAGAATDTVSSALRARAIPVLRLLAVASVAAPVALFGVASWIGYHDALQSARREAEQAVTLLEHGLLRVLGANMLAMRYVNDMLSLVSDAELVENEKTFHARLRQIEMDLPEVAGVWVIDHDGNAILASSVYPIPRGINAADRPYFKAHSEQGRAVYIGEPIVGRVVPTKPFTISVPWKGPDGRFRGVIQNSLDPAQFARLSAAIERESGLAATLVRADGMVLARHPGEVSPGTRLSSDSPLLRAISNAEETGAGRGISTIDGKERLFAFRKLGAFPVYVTAGVTHEAVVAAFLSKMASHLVFGIPATLCLLALTVFALRRTRRLADEADRRHRAEDALRQAQKLEALGQLTGGVAHDFNNLLTVIRGSVELLDVRAGQDHEKTVKAVLDAAERGATLTRQLLTFSRAQVLRPQVLDLRFGFPKLRSLIGLSLRGDIELTVDWPPDLSRIKADPGELELAMLNVAVNARDAMPEGGKLTITARNVRFTSAADAETGLVGSFVEIMVRDTGIGIVPENLGRIFEPFFTTKSTGVGTGLGLSQVYGFARQSGGTVTVASEPAIGTRVSIFLPATDEPPDVTETGPGLTPVRSAARILLVDDNDEVAGVTRALLEGVGCVVSRAESGVAALDLLDAAHDFDLVVSDIVMPGGLTGVDLARALRSLAPQLPVLLITGYSAAAESAAREGFDILRKPYGRDDLMNAVARQLDRVPPPSASSKSPDGIVVH